MAMDWKVLQKEIDAENTRIIDEAPEDIERVFKYEIIPTGAGTAKTTLGVWFEGATAARYVAAYNTYNIIKLAMVRVHSRLAREGLAARLIMQVHDELIVECPEEEAPRVEALLQQEMQGVAELSVPLLAEAHTGRNWLAAKG